jgi:hypothetical protein
MIPIICLFSYVFRNILILIIADTYTITHESLHGKNPCDHTKEDFEEFFGEEVNVNLEYFLGSPLKKI